MITHKQQIYDFVKFYQRAFQNYSLPCKIYKAKMLFFLDIFSVTIIFGCISFVIVINLNPRLHFVLYILKTYFIFYQMTSFFYYVLVMYFTVLNIFVTITFVAIIICTKCEIFDILNTINNLKLDDDYLINQKKFQKGIKFCIQKHQTLLE